MSAANVICSEMGYPEGAIGFHAGWRDDMEYEHLQSQFSEDITELECKAEHWESCSYQTRQWWGLYVFLTCKTPGL